MHREWKRPVQGRSQGSKAHTEAEEQRQGKKRTLMLVPRDRQTDRQKQDKSQRHRWWVGTPGRLRTQAGSGADVFCL